MIRNVPYFVNLWSKANPNSGFLTQLKNYEESGHFTNDGEKLTSLCVVEQSQIEEIGSLLRDKEKSHTQVETHTQTRDM